jgi:hypothetical protein
MENFKLASQRKLRFQTSKGSLSTEQLWDLSLEDLDALAVSLETEHKQSGKKSFLVKTSAKDKTAKLRFDVALDVLNTKVEEMQAAQEAAEIKEHNKKIIQLISEKQDESLKGKSIKQLEAMLK